MNHDESDIPRDLDPHTFASFERLEAARTERERIARDRYKTIVRPNGLINPLRFGAPIPVSAPRKRVAKRAAQASPTVAALEQARRSVKAGNYMGGLFAIASAAIHAQDNASAIRALQAALAA
jgi:hypothetical protein